MKISLPAYNSELLAKGEIWMVGAAFQPRKNCRQQLKPPSGTIPKQHVNFFKKDKNNALFYQKLEISACCFLFDQRIFCGTKDLMQNQLIGKAATPL
jgi:hypothetical protein